MHSISPKSVSERSKTRRSILATELGLSEVENKGMQVIGGGLDELHGFLVPGFRAKRLGGGSNGWEWSESARGWEGRVPARRDTFRLAL